MKKSTLLAAAAASVALFAAVGCGCGPQSSRDDAPATRVVYVAAPAPTYTQTAPAYGSAPHASVPDPDPDVDAYGGAAAPNAAPDGYVVVTPSPAGRTVYAQPSRGGSREPFYLIVGIDTSLSARHMLSSYGAVLRKLAVRMNVPGDQLSVLRIDNESREVSGPRPPRGSFTFMRELAATARPAPSLPGTYHAIFMDRAARLTRNSELPVVILLLTDGVNDDLSSAAMNAMRRTATDLASMPQFRRVIWAGVEPGWRERIRDEMERQVGPGRLSFESLSGVTFEAVLP